MDADAIVVGAGPTGLALAAELRLGGAEVIVLEQRQERTWESRGIGFTARATEMFEQRGILESLDNIEITRQGHFGGIPIDYGVLEGSHFGVRGAPQYQTEEMLENWALGLGAAVRRGHRVTGLLDTGRSVTVTADGPAGTQELTARYVVGCDGGRSTVRHLGGFDFAGTEATREMYLADVAGCDIAPRMIGEMLPNGMVMAAPLEAGFTRIIVCENGIPPSGGREVTFMQVADAWERLTGESIHHGEARWMSSFTDATRQATEYRRGRVILAGDAAHIHLPAGGQGLSIGVQDAFNLGWKLAATVRGWAPDGLLDTYHAERHPVGARVLRNTLAQGTLNLTGRSVAPLRSVMSELISLPVVARHFSGMVSGFDIRYAMGASTEGGHPLVGCRMPDRELELADGGRDTIARRMHGARGVLITTDASDGTGGAVAGWSDRVDTVVVQRFPSGPEDRDVTPEAVLVRPDGYVAWAAPGAGDLQEALHRWFGRPIGASSGARDEAGSGQDVRRMEHTVDVAAPAQRVYDLIVQVEHWPEIFPPTVHAEVVERSGNDEVIKLWATANGAAKTWTSRRRHDTERMSLSFRQERSQHPVGGMGGEWVVEPLSSDSCRVRLLHDFHAATSDPADLDWITEAVDRNSASELQALKQSAEPVEDGELLTFEDSVSIDGNRAMVYAFLNDAQLWHERLPHVARVSFEEETPGLQVLEMDTRTEDGRSHTTKSVRVCQEPHAITYKQIVLPQLMSLHTGRWSIEEREGGGVDVTSRHTVRINAANVPSVLGAAATVQSAKDFVRTALSRNSLATLALAKAHVESESESVGSRRASP